MSSMDAASDDRRSMAYGLPCRIRHLTKHLPQVYRGIEISEDVKRLPTAASKYEKGMSLGVMSKALGLAGLRVGWIASQVSCACVDANLEHHTSADAQASLRLC